MTRGEVVEECVNSHLFSAAHLSARRWLIVIASLAAIPDGRANLLFCWHMASSSSGKILAAFSASRRSAWR